MLNSIYELDLLEIRLNVLGDVVDETIILEGDHTHSGKPKEFIFNEYKERFDSFHISYFQAELDPYISAWDREYQQRRGLYQCVEPFSKSDLIISSDLDEVPDPDVVLYAHKERQSMRAVLDLHYFYLNTRVGQRWVQGTMLLTGQAAEGLDWRYCRTSEYFTEVEEAGWHWSSCLTEEGIRHKLGSFAHTEFDNEEATNKAIDNYHNLRGIGNEILSVVDIDSRYPKYLQDNIDKYKHLCYST